MPIPLSRVAAWLISLLLLVTLAAVIVWTIRSEPTTLALPTPQPVAQVTATPLQVAATEPATPTAMVALAATATLPPMAEATVTPAATATAEATPESTSDAAPANTATPEATATAAQTATLTATSATAATSTATATITTTATASVTPTPTPTPTPTATATVTATAPSSATAPATGTAIATPSAVVADAAEITTVQIIELPVPTPTSSLPFGEWRSVTDPNQMNGLAVISNTVWIAGSGGALAWSKGSNAPVIYTAADGLLGNQLNAVANCALPGFGVVFGGPTGLQIGDPRTGRWRPLASGSGGPRYDDVTALHCDADNGFLIAGFAEHGIAIYDVADEEWRYLDRNSGLAANDARRIAVVGDREQIWVASNEGVTVSAGSDSNFYDSGNSPLTADRVGALLARPDGSVWLGGEGALYRVENEEWTVYTADEAEGDFPTELITGMAWGPDGSLWLGATDAVVCRFDVEQERCADFFAGESGMAPGLLTNLAVDAGGDVYYTTAGNGYAVYDGRTWRSLAVRNPQLAGNRVKALAYDADGSLWAATEAGVQQLAAGEPPRLFDAANSGISPLGVRTLHPGAEGGIWVGGMQGASFFDGEAWQTLTVEDGLAGENVQAITVDGDGRTWFGGDRGISIWNGSSFFVIDAAQGLPSEDIRALAADAEGVWIGTAGGGLYRFAGNQLQLLNAKNVGLPSDNITALAIGGDGALWIGTDRGLAELAGGAVTVVDALGKGSITALTVDEQGIVWAARAGGGVLAGSGGDWTALNVGDGLPAARITAIAAAGDQVWLGGQDGGIAVFAPSNE